MVKLSDYLVRFLEEYGVRDAFMISGGLAMHLNDSIGKSNKITYYCHFHEQAAAMAAETYAKVTGKLGVCMVTGGPASSNAITGVVNMWQDSVPGLFISGNVRTEISAEGTELRQLGEQELEIAHVVGTITKYAVRVTDPATIRYHLEKAVYLATSGRPGPVWIDVPLDVQAATIKLETLKSFSRPISPIPPVSPISLNKTVSLLKKSNRPVLLAGNGIRISGAYHNFLKLVDKLQMPVVTASCANDLMWATHPLYFGNPGLIGDRTANFIIQNSDCVLAIGARLNFKTISFNYKAFAREAKLIVVDIDREELNKKTIRPHLKIHADAGGFIKALTTQSKKSTLPDYTWWIKRCRHWQKLFPKLLPQYKKDGDRFVNQYYFMHILSQFFREGDIVVSCNGITALTTFLMAELKKNQRLIANIGAGGLGYDLPGAIGACIANNKKPVTLTVGDGSIQFNLQELQTIVTYKLPIKIFVYDNKGYLSIRNTQKAYFEGREVAAGETTGVICPDMTRIAKAFGIPSVTIQNHRDLKEKIRKVYKTPGPVICIVNMSPTMEVLPRMGSEILPDGRMVSKPMEDMYPHLPRDVFEREMIVKPLKYD